MIISTENISNQGWKNGMDELDVKTKESELIYKSYYKTLDRDPLNDIDKTNKGLHIYRRLQAEIKHLQRIKTHRESSYENNDIEFQEQYFKEGIVIVEKFVGSPDDLIRIKKEFENYPIGVSKNPRNILTQNRDRGRLLYQLSNLIYPIIWSLIGGTEKETEKKFRDNTFAQRVENKPQEKDHQKLIHLDTYFPAIKYWWFPEKVAKEQGPLCYVKNSCYSNEKMQKWYYKQSVDVVVNKDYESWRGKDHLEGSFRVSEEELNDMGYELEPIEVDEDTLVIGNVAGFHSRADASTEHIRNAIHGSIRLELPLESE